MQHVSELVVPESFLSCSQGIVLECRCGEKLLLLGRETDWPKEGRSVFECSGCEEKLSLSGTTVRRRVEA